MTIATKPTTVRIDENLKAQANEILGSVGLSYNAYVVMATRQLVNQRRIPFEIVPAVGIPNEETRRALVAAEAKEVSELMRIGAAPDECGPHELSNPGGNCNGHIDFHLSDGMVDVAMLCVPHKTNPA